MSFTLDNKIMGKSIKKDMMKQKVSRVETITVPFSLGEIKENIIISTKSSEDYRKENLPKQELLYKAHGLDRTAGLQKINETFLDLFGRKYNEESGMMSEHFIMFASLAAKQFNPKKILEIGTYKGFSSLVLATLFPDSKVFTIDLKSDDDKFKESYNRRKPEERKEFLKVRNKYLKSKPNIEFIEESSLLLTIRKEFKDQFDLIWIDGAHGYPIVCADIINSVSLANSNTIIMCDDVFKNIEESDAMYDSIASFETIEELIRSGIISCGYFLKRLGISKTVNDQYIGYISLNTNKIPSQINLVQN